MYWASDCWTVQKKNRVTARLLINLPHYVQLDAKYACIYMPEKQRGIHPGVPDS
jgi:hypothetical protein